nr:hypothetical protein [Tanacetum cinerariifolium]
MGLGATILIGLAVLTGAATLEELCLALLIGTILDLVKTAGDPQATLRDTGIFDSGCSWHMIGNKSFLSYYQECNGGFVAFAGSSKGGKITGKGKTRTGKLDFEDVYFVKELKFKLFSVSQICDNGTEFKNYEMNQFCGIKGIKKEFSNARTSQQNKVAERKNRTLIEAARTMILVIKPHNKTPYELLIGRPPIISFIRPFGCPVTILNTLDHLGKFDGKANEGFLVGYLLNNKAFRVYNSITKKVKEKLHVNFLENKPDVAGSGPEWMFDIDYLTNSINYQPISAGNRTNGITGLKIHFDVGQEGKKKVFDQEYILLPVMNTSSDVPSSNEEVESSPKDNAGKKSIVEPTCVEGGKIDDLGCLDQQMKSTDDSKNTNITNINDVGSSFSHLAALDDFSKMPNLENTGIFDDAYDDRDVGAEADYNNLGTMEPKKETQALDDKSWVEAMQEELLQNKRDQIGIVVRNKAKLVAQGHRQEEGIDYDELVIGWNYMGEVLGAHGVYRKGFGTAEGTGGYAGEDEATVAYGHMGCIGKDLGGSFC